MATFHVTYTHSILQRMKSKLCNSCKKELKEGDEGMRINGSHTKHYHKECYKRIHH